MRGPIKFEEYASDKFEGTQKQRFQYLYSLKNTFLSSMQRVSAKYHYIFGSPMIFDPDEFSVNLCDPVEIFFRLLMKLDNLIDHPKDTKIHDQRRVWFGEDNIYTELDVVLDHED